MKAIFFLIVPPKSVVVGSPPARKSGSRVTLACTAEDSNPKTDLVWLLEGKPMLQAGKIGSKPALGWKKSPKLQEEE